MLGSRNGSDFATATGPAYCSNGPCMLGGYHAGLSSNGSIILGIGAHDTGNFTQNGTCTSAATSHKGMYSGAPAHQWSQKGYVYIR